MSESVILKGLSTAAHQKTTWVVIAATLITSIFGVLTAEESKPLTVEISERTTFDPIYNSNPGFDFRKSSFCDDSSTGGFMGVSANIDEQSINNNHARILFLKIDLSKIPDPIDSFSTVKITKADLVLKTIYDPIINEPKLKKPLLCNE